MTCAKTLRLLLLRTAAALLATSAAGLIASAAAAAEPVFKSVEEILQGTPFQVVTPAQYKARTKTGKVVGFFYESANVAGADGWRAKNFKEAIDPKLGLTYLAIARSAAVPDTEYLSLELFTSPAYYLYHNGQKVFSAGGGDPNPTPEVFAKETEILKNNLKVLSGMK